MVAVAKRNKQRQEARSTPVVQHNTLAADRRLQEAQVCLSRQAKYLVKADQRIAQLEYERKELMSHVVELGRRPSIQSVAVAFGITLAIFGAVIAL